VHYLVKARCVHTSGHSQLDLFQGTGYVGRVFPWHVHTGVNLTMGRYGQLQEFENAGSPSFGPDRTPCKPGLPVREQHKAGKRNCWSTSFEPCERKIRDQLVRILAGGGFDPAADIEAITVNRCARLRLRIQSAVRSGMGARRSAARDRSKTFRKDHHRQFRSAATAYTDAAIDQAYRAVRELLA